MSGPRKFQILVLFGPSGAGKSTLFQKLKKEFPEAFGFSVSHTTRNPRPGEEDGVHYHFVTRDHIIKGVAAGEFIESAEFASNMYGTSQKAVEDVISKNKICILDIDVQGVKSVKKTNLSSLTGIVYIAPPSLEVLEQRLRSRGTETEDSLAKRLTFAKGEMEYGQQPGNADLIIVNDDVEVAYSALKKFVVPSIDNIK